MLRCTSSVVGMNQNGDSTSTSPGQLLPSQIQSDPAVLCSAASERPGAAVLALYHLGYANNPVIPFSDMVANYSNGTSDYNAFTVNVNRRFSGHWQMLASYTWGHAIDDSTDLQATLQPQDDYHPNADRSNSLFDLRQRFVFSAVYQSNHVGSGFLSALLSNWTVAPIIEVATGRPFDIGRIRPKTTRAARTGR